ncbi:MAG TPA: M17 family peptidase N-terminal domain-containing protein, partial [Agromyces sp.]|nr:M17 family peptidase N-terminal domain-containing protein [Agromyces sp.]
MTRSPNTRIPEEFTPMPSLDRAAEVVVVDELDEGGLDAIGVLITSDGDLPAGVDLDREALSRAGFEAKSGTTLVLPNGAGPLTVLVGAGSSGELDAAGLRDAAAAFARATWRFGRIGLRVPAIGSADAAAAAQSLAEGALLARYRFTALQREPKDVPLERIELLLDGVAAGAAAAGARAGTVTARAANIARDLANCPPGHLTAIEMADVAVALGRQFGFDVEVFDRQQLIELGCGGLLGVNAGSAEEPRMVKLRYTPPDRSSGHLGLIGKGIMYDSGGISLKPSDPMHLLMKMDMGGAASVLAAFTALRALRGTAAVTGWLMCTDNMPSGSAYKLGDVLTARDGRTVEVKNTDAEGRLAMMDAFVLANEDGVDAIVDIATLTGAALMALGPSIAAVLGNDSTTIGLVKAAAAVTGEAVWELPLEKKYRPQLDSDVADISNLGGPYAGATTAALFLAEFVG